MAEYREGEVIDQDKEKEFPGYNWIVKNWGYHFIILRAYCLFYIIADDI